MEDWIHGNSRSNFKTLSSVRDGIERILRSRLCASTPAQLGFLGWFESRSFMDESVFKHCANNVEMCVFNALQTSKV